MVDPPRAFTEDQLAQWGLLRQVQRESLIDHYLLEAPRPDEPSLKALLEQWCLQQRIESAEALSRWQIQRGLTHESWEALATRPWRWAQWCLKTYEPQLNSYYLERKPQLDQVVYSLLRVQQKALASELYLRIKEGEATFEDIAAAYSEGPERSSGGRLGPVALSQPHPVLARLLQVSTPGQLWPPKQLESWWIVVRLEQLVGAELNQSTAMQLALELGEQHLGQILDRASSTTANAEVCIP
jgi:parvulin-like peptidyl-prolyl isomerase